MAKVLVIDDTPEYIEMLDDILPYDVYAATDGKKGLELAAKVMPDIILLDINMPHMNGYDVCRRLKLNKKLHSIPVIFLTSNDGSDFEEIGLKMGAVDYISKPFNAIVLQARVKTHMDLYTLQLNLKDEVNTRVEEIKRLNEEMIFVSASIAEMRSQETGEHLKRVSKLSYKLASCMGRSERELEMIQMASILHDIGKVGIPDAILNKAGPLEDTELEIMQKHPKLGYDFLKNSEVEFMKFAAVIALEHHEKWDGSGYPQGLKGEDISFFGRLVAVADVFDSLLDARVYKPAWSAQDVKQYFNDMRAVHFDPEITDVLLEHFDDFIALREDGEAL